MTMIVLASVKTAFYSLRLIAGIVGHFTIKFMLYDHQLSLPPINIMHSKKNAICILRNVDVFYYIMLLFHPIKINTVF